MAGVGDNAILDFHQRFVARVRNGRQDVLRNAYENVLMYLGLHWITYDPGLRNYRLTNLRRDTPRPVTNKYKANLDAGIAVLSRVEPSLTIAPGTDQDDDRITADLGRMVIKYLEKIVHFQDLRLSLSSMIWILNNAYVHCGIDPTAGTRKSMPKWTCASHPDVALSAEQAHAAGGMCRTDGTPLIPHPTEVDTLPQGAPYADLCTPFETWVDYSVKLMRDQPVVMLRQLRTRQWLREHYPDAKERPEGWFTGTGDIGLTYLQSIIRLTPGATLRGFGTNSVFRDCIVVDTLYALPCKEFPRGLETRIVAEDEVVESKDELTSHDGTPAEKGRPFIPVVHFGFDDVPGTHTKTGPADHLKALQKERNRLQSSIMLYFARTANGVWLLPEGSDVATPSGEEGWVMRYTPVGSQGAKPERMDGGRLPNAFVEWIRYIDEEMQDISGLYDVLRGDRPPSITSGYALQILQERAQGRFATLYLGWERSYAELARTLFMLFRNNAPDEIYYQIKGEQARWTVQRIKTANLHGGIDIDVEAGSARPKTSLEKRAATEQALQMFPQLAMDPKVQLTALRQLGVPELMEESNVDDEAIAKEHAMLIDWAKSVTDPQTGGLRADLDPEAVALPVLVDPLLDNHDLHLARHRVWMLSEEYQGLPDFVQAAFRDGHFAEHVMIVQMAAVPPPQQGGGGGEPQGGAAAEQRQGEGNAVASEQGGGTTGREQRRAQQAEGAMAPATGGGA